MFPDSRTGRTARADRTRVTIAAGDDRWPRSVYGYGDEPDYRFSFANERTFLAWIRTSLALLAGGVALDAVELSLPRPLQRGLAGAIVALALVCALASWVRWARAERAMRCRQPLASSSISVFLTVGIAAAALAVLLAVVM